MVSRLPVVLVLVYFCSFVSSRHLHLDSNGTLFTDMSGFSSPDCTFPREVTKQPPFVLNLKHNGKRAKPADHVAESKAKDLARLRNLNSRITAASIAVAGNPNIVSGIQKSQAASDDLHELMMATLESGVSVGSGEYLMDVFIGTPPKHFLMILDTGSDLNWIQCVPCYDCFEQTGPYYDPHESSSFRQVSCKDARCPLVNSPANSQTCVSENQSCPYYYWYGDSSNTTGELALETFTVNLTATENGESHFRKVENVMFGCGHWNRGLFHGAAGLLGLGRGPLSFSSQLRSLFGHSFSYCLVDRNSNSSVSSKLIFGQDLQSSTYKELNFTTLLSGKQDKVDTFYYLHIKAVIVGGETLNIPEETWDLSSGGTIIDSGTTLSYFADPAYTIIKEAFMSKMRKLYPVVENFPILESCYNISGVEEPEIPSFGIKFVDGAEWNFPADNYFIKLEPEEVICLAMLGTRSDLSIIGNYQQQNFHVMYDINNSRLGFAPTKCSEL